MIRVKKLHHSAKLPERAHDTDLGYDLFSTDYLTISPNESVLVPTGLAIAMPDGWGLLLKDRSSISSKHNVYVHAGVIDNGYHGQIKILMHNHSNQPFDIFPGNKIAQAVPIPIPGFEVVEVETIEEETTRGSFGFGSTGT